MSKEYRNHVAHSECASSDICDFGDEICVIGEVSPKSINSHLTVELSDSENEYTKKRRHEKCSDDSDSESESNKYLRIKKSVPSDEIRIIDEVHPSHESDLCKVSDRYPPVPFGVRRLKVKHEAIIQKDVEKIRACPGLEQVTEIKGLKETSYFCGICDKPYGMNDIISHLRSDKHKKRSLKALKPEKYEWLKTIPKKKRRHYLNKTLRDIKVSEGIRKIIVEKDYLNYEASQNLDTPGTSAGSAYVVYSSIRNSNLVLSDCSKANYFCRACQCNMFDTELWESHSKGRLCELMEYPDVSQAPQIKDVKKLRSSDGFLINTLYYPFDEPMVGLDYVREFKITSPNKITYHCLLCRQCLDEVTVRRHLKSPFHRKRYLEHMNYPLVNDLSIYSYEIVRKVKDICKNFQMEFGSGCPEVYAVNFL